MARTKSVDASPVQGALFIPGSSIDEFIHVVSLQLDALATLQVATADALARLRQLKETGLKDESLLVERTNPVSFYAGFSLTIKL